MPARNSSVNGICYIAWDNYAFQGKTGDSGHHTLRLICDGLERTPANLPAEVDSGNCPGLYKINLTADEMNSQIITLAGNSSTAGVTIVPVQITTSAAIASTNFNPTSVVSSPIWTDAFLNSLANDGITQIAVEIPCVWAREALTITRGVSTVTLPSYVRQLLRVTWRGRTLDPTSFEEFSMMLAPASAFAAPGSSANVEGSQGRPLWYTMHPTNIYDIRFYPTPGESFVPSQIPDVYAPTINEPGCVISYKREPDLTNLALQPPQYILRRTVKAYVLWKAFAAETKGQDSKASAYYKAKWDFLIESFRHINDGCFVSKRYAIDNGDLTIDNFKYPKPIHPANFERTVF